jgi:CheY-like chemotaxis protein
MKRILVVDDSKTARMASEMVLKGNDYEVLLASDGREAVEKAVAERPDLILMDLVMPTMDGLAALRTIRSIESVGGVPVIVVSTRSEPDYLEKSYELGCNDYITKPVDGVELVAKIRSLIGE